MRAEIVTRDDVDKMAEQACARAAVAGTKMLLVVPARRYLTAIVSCILAAEGRVLLRGSVLSWRNGSEAILVAVDRERLQGRTADIVLAYLPWKWPPTELAAVKVIPTPASVHA